MPYIHIGGINRSGGSLLARLFDGHPDTATYPSESGFPFNDKIYPFMDFLPGSPLVIPHFNPAKDTDILKFFGISPQKPAVVHKWGKESADPVGVRLNYLEKEYYGTVKTYFDYDRYIREIQEFAKNAKTLQDVYDVKHAAYFNAWEDGKYKGSMKFVVTHDSGDLFITNVGKFFEEFRTSIFVHPIRNITGYIASEKTRMTRRYYGSRRFPVIKMPNVFVKNFKHYDLKALMRSWLVAMTRVVLLQERLGVDKKFIVIRYENLVNKTEEVMKALCTKSGLAFHPCLLKPTLAGRPWGGNSHQGRQSGINPNLASYYREVLRDDELELIQKGSGPILEFLNQCMSTPVDFTAMPKKILFDYDFQKKYFDDEEKMALYSAFAFHAMRKVPVAAPDASAFFALLYANAIRLIHIPRLLKLKLFPGLGRQNYT